MKGTIASVGKALAKAFILIEPELVVQKTDVKDAKGEMSRFEAAREECSRQFDDLIGGMDEDEQAETIEILEFQQLMLEDTDLLDKIEKIITVDKLNCEYAVESAFGEYIRYLQSLTDNDYLRERATDIGDLAHRLLCVLLGVRTEIDEPDEQYIVVAEDITPSRMAQLDHKKLSGIILEQGGQTSHCVILANSLGIPCLIGAKGMLEAAAPGQAILLDAVNGEIILAPNEERIKEYAEYREQYAREQEMLQAYAHVPSRTKDGAYMGVFANITSDKEIEALLSQGAEGVGLLRTELLYMSESVAPPSEEKQYAMYAGIASALGELPLIIRTLDVGGDKKIEYLGIEQEDNPFLGYRAIRYCLEHTELFKEQIAAILRAGRNVQMMFPMITGKAEIEQARQIVAEVQSELETRGVPYCKEAKIGIMVETPAAALDCERLAKEVDFFSIGTNDLTQYLFAADRTNAKVSGLNSHYQPALLRAIDKIARAAHENGIDVDICGQAGEAAELIPLWIAMGVSAVSVSVPSVTKVRRLICESIKSDCEKLLRAVLDMDTADEVEKALRQNK